MQHLPEVRGRHATRPAAAAATVHSHVFLGEGHEQSERRTWAVIWLCGAMMVAEIVGGLLFGSIALVADGLHMSTHAGALLLAALAYTYARKHADDPRFTFGTGKLGDLAGFTSAIILAMIALLIGYEAVSRLFAPVADPLRRGDPDRRASAWPSTSPAPGCSAAAAHHHGHGHGHGHGATIMIMTRAHAIATAAGAADAEVFEDGVPPRFRLRAEPARPCGRCGRRIETVRPDGTRQVFAMRDRGGYLESVDEIPEPHAFTAACPHRRSDNPYRSLSRSTSTRTARRSATTTCAPPWST